MDTSYLTQQVTTIIGKLHSLFDEIGVPSHERDSRESELFSSLSTTLHNHLKLVAGEKNDLFEEGQRIIVTIQQLEQSLDDSKTNSQYAPKTEPLRVTYPLNDCLQMLREKHRAVSKLHQERYEQVKKLLEALESYSSHLESSFLQIKLPPVAADGTVPPTFDLSPSYINSVDNEFTRVYEEYNRRVSHVQQVGQDIVNLWAELGTPQAQTESSIVKYWRDSPEQLGLHQNDINSLESRRSRLVDEKKAREKRMKDLRSEIEGLWDRLGVEESQRKAFHASNRGCGLRAINDLEDELSRLIELKRQNLHLFVEDARTRLQNLWDELYFSEEEAVEFTPMFCDVYSDALLSAHEAEISRLEALKEQRAPTLQLIEKHRSLIKDREDLAASSQDASRLLMKGAKGERRDPTRLLREEKMRKRIAKDLPKVEAELTKVLDAWEDEYGRPFMVFGERYLDLIEEAAAKVPPPRSKTPNALAPTAKPAKAPVPSQPSRQANREPASTLRSKTPIGGGTIRGKPVASTKSAAPTLSPSKSAATTLSPSKIPARIPLGHHNGNSPERQQRSVAHTKGNESGTARKVGMAPPPKMRDLYNHPQPPTPANGFQPDVSRSGSVVRQITPEDPYNDQSHHVSLQNSYMGQSQQSSSSRGHAQAQQYYAASAFNTSAQDHHPMAPPPRPNYHHGYEVASTISTAPSTAPSYASSTSSRQISGASSATTTTGSASENWEAYAASDDGRDFPEVDATEYYAKIREGVMRGQPYGAAPLKRPADIGTLPRGAKMLRDGDGMGREASWTTEEETY